MDEEEVERVKSILTDLAYKVIDIINDMVKPFTEGLIDLFNNLEPYQQYEILHPRKKPRGSIRRNKRQQPYKSESETQK